MYRNEATHRHALGQAVIALYQWFGEREFLVRDLSVDQKNELAGFLGIESNRPNSVETRSGQWLSKQGEIDFVLLPDGSGSVSVEVVEPAGDSDPGVYRIVKRERPNDFRSIR